MERSVTTVGEPAPHEMAPCMAKARSVGESLHMAREKSHNKMSVYARLAKLELEAAMLRHDVADLQRQLSIQEGKMQKKDGDIATKNRRLNELQSVVDRQRALIDPNALLQLKDPVLGPKSYAGLVEKIAIYIVHELSAVGRKGNSFLKSIGGSGVL